MIETEYNGQRIHYSENEDLWRCDLLDFKAKTLTAIKSKISKWLADARRVGNVPVIYVGSTYTPEFKEAQVVLKDDDGKHVWIMVNKMRGGVSSNQGREKVKLETIMADTPENRARIAAYRAKQEEARKINAEQRELLEAMPRLTMEAFEALPVEEKAA
ncbi:hypothetical protein [Sphingobium yanoikuyae]|uniref:hypothetical protein n=1 Tax=Sphingobium yanoikuyae TaxID=13690 RepID=UPI0035C6C180